MASYSIVFKRSVARDLRRFPKTDLRRILKRINALAEEPRPPGAEKLTGDELYRVRQGNYRILYAIEDDIITVTIVNAGYRRDVQR